MLADKLRPVIEPITTGTGRVLARARITPDALTIFGLAAMTGCSLLVAAGRTVLGGILLIPAFLIDVFDGALARATGRVTPWGGFLDSVADRLADGVLFGAVVWLGAAREDRMMVAAALVALVLSLAVPYARAKAEALGYRASSGLGERAERAVVICAGLILGYVTVAMWITAALTLVTLAGRTRSVWKQARGA
ncbi:MAG TPA: CDP-alcohol phosphatidyltransferase family protein [Actinomycetota bacterium]